MAAVNVNNGLFELLASIFSEEVDTVCFRFRTAS